MQGGMTQTQARWVYLLLRHPLAMSTKKTFTEAASEARRAELEGWTDRDIEIAKRVNRLALLMEGDKQAAGLALICDLLIEVIDGEHSINVSNRGN